MGMQRHQNLCDRGLVKSRVELELLEVLAQFLLPWAPVPVEHSRRPGFLSRICSERCSMSRRQALCSTASPPRKSSFLAIMSLGAMSTVLRFAGTAAASSCASLNSRPFEPEARTTLPPDK